MGNGNDELDAHENPTVNWRNIPITLIIPQKGEGKAHTCELACSCQLMPKFRMRVIRQRSFY
jgi:hypothetical protein